MLAECPALRGPRQRRSSTLIAGLRHERPTSRRASTSSARATRRTPSTSSGTGRVALETFVPGARAACLIETIDAGDVSAGRGSSRRTAGTSTPARSTPSARSPSTARACARSATTTRLGYELMQRFAQVMIERCRRPGSGCSTSMATARVAEHRAAAAPMAPLPVPRRAAPRARPPTRGRSTLEPRAARRRGFAPGQFTMVYAFGVGEVPISVSGDPSRRAARPHGARRRRGHDRAICARAAGRGARRARAVRHRLAGRRPRRAATSSSSPAGSASRRCARSSTRARPPRRPTARTCSSTARRTPDDLLYPSELERWRERPASRSTSRSTRPSDDWRGQVGVVHDADRASALRPDATTALRLRPRDHDALHRSARCSTRGVAPDRIHVSLERNMNCGVGHCGHCQLGPTSSAATGRSSRYAQRRAPARRCGSCDGQRRKPKLAVWKFASCDGCQLSLLDCEDELLALAGEVEIAYFLEATSAIVAGPYDLSLVEGSITTAARRGADPARSGGSRRRWSRSAPARPPAASRRCATSPTWTSSSSIVYASPGVHLDARDLDADRRPRPGRLRAARLPDRQAPAARGDHRVPARPPARRSRLQRLHRVQAARQRLRHGRARHALPRAGHARRLRRALPGVQPRLLRLLRADGDAEHAVARPRWLQRLGADRPRPRARLPHVQRRRAEPFRRRASPADG